jgi:heparin/heparan-sulfate lyase
MRVIDSEAGHYHYAMGDASNAYSGHKLRRFTREIVYVPGHRTLFVFDRVVSTNAAFRKAWLLHGVNEPAVSGEGHAAAQGTTEFPNARTFRFNDATGELLVHSLLPRNRTVTRRGGPGYEFFTPGDDHGGDWGTGENWPLDPPGGGPLPKDPRLQHMWKVFYGEDFAELWKSNRKNVVPGAWRIEVSPATPAEEDLFLHVLEIGDHGTTGSRRVELLEGINFAGAAVEGGPAVLFSTAGAVITEGEATLPGIACDELLITSLQPKAIYDVNFFGPEFGTSPRPGVSAGTLRPRSNDKGILRIDIRSIGNARVRVARV